MSRRKRIRDFSIAPGILKPGRKNAVTDVKGVKVGHFTIAEGDAQTGVTAVIPASGNLFKEKLPAACYVINGFGKSVGLMQIEELHQLETPILLTNTFSVSACIEGLLDFVLEENHDIGKSTGTVNPVVLECNDGYLNDIRRRFVRKHHVQIALQQAQDRVEEGAVGAGRGMSCYGLKGGIGTASRCFSIGAKMYTLGTLVLTNFGLLHDLTIDGMRVGEAIASDEGHKHDLEKGSVIVIIATDCPLLPHQLKRVARRVQTGLARTGAINGGGSGEIAIAFSTAYRLFHEAPEPVTLVPMLADKQLDLVFRATVEATEEAVLNSMITAQPVKGRDGHQRKSLSQYVYHFAKKPSSSRSRQS